MLRNATPADFPAILQLNDESEHFLSPLTRPRLAKLHALAAYHRVIVLDGVLVAFLLAFREGTKYDSPNYRWFATRYPQYLYIDRVAVSATHRGNRYGALLYADLFSFARESSMDACYRSRRFNSWRLCPRRKNCSARSCFCLAPPRHALRRRWRQLTATWPSRSMRRSRPTSSDRSLLRSKRLSNYLAGCTMSPYRISICI